ncbi:TetR family transcriptional regulator, partial [Frankia sp. Cpl3]|nr:TetR family transcriptional regulator [Frankia sp. Cpl3]
MQPSDEIVRVVLELLESGGYEGVRLRDVALRAQVSLTTIYRVFPTRNELIVAALEQWLAVHADPQLLPTPAPECLYDGLMRIFRRVLEPWMEHPQLLAAWVRSQREPGGYRLFE